MATKFEKPLKPSLDNTFCAQPWVGLQLKPTYRIRPCCMFIGDLGEYTDNDSLKQAYSSAKIKKVREKMLNNVWPEECKACKCEEESTGSSPRIESPGLRSSVEEHEKNLSFRRIEASISNICNLDCVMCSPRFSSKWNKIVPELNQEKINYMNLNEARGISLPRKDVIALLDQSEHADEVLLIGGEPLIGKEGLFFIEEWARRGYKGKLILVTNGTFINEESLQALQACSNVLLNLSIDGFGPTYSWIRGFPWEDIERRIMLSKEYIENMLVNPTISVFNLLNFSELSEFCDKNGLTIWPAHFLDNPSFQSALNIRLEDRIVISEQFDFNRFSELGFFLKQDSPDQAEQKREQAKNWIHFFNKKREINLFEVQPLLKNYLR